MARLTPKQREALKLVAEGKFFPDLVREEDGWHARWRALGGENSWVDEFVREANVTRLTEDAEDQKHETLHDAWIMALRSISGLVRWKEEECAFFAEELKRWHGDGEDGTQEIKFRFETTPEFSLSCELPKHRKGLKALGQAVYVYGLLRGLKVCRGTDGKGERLAVTLNRKEAETFLRVGARDLSIAGYQLEGVELKAEVLAEAEIESAELGEKGAAGENAQATAKLIVRVAGEIVSAAEVRFLLEQGSSLVFFRDRWIEVDRGILRQALRALEKTSGKVLGRMEAVSFALGIGRFGSLEIGEARAHGWLRGLLNELKKRGEFTGLTAATRIPGLAGDLRDYQARGVAWMEFLTNHGFGALLADDMGLGKTIQTIGWLLRVRGPNRKFLIVAPLTLLNNWKHEFAKFAPEMKVFIHQGTDRYLENSFRLVIRDAEVVVTSYSLLVRDFRTLRGIDWEGLVLDEAQMIKNPDTQAAKAVRALAVPRRIALTGTPVENSPADIWSLEEFLNPTFLGKRKDFVERFVKPLSLTSESSAGPRLKRALEPFLMRRLKSDPQIAAELGEKREIREYCPLTERQRQDYEAALADYRVSERKRGDVFALLTALKLICDETEGGKFARLLELVESIFEAGESVLVFSQYAKVGGRLKAALDAKFGPLKTRFLHGELSANERERELRAFNAGGAKAFVLSLKAGGYGLNLTKATHVIHFDRWWNPAVENQATDRAHRIGQNKTVFVHYFITEGTLEERIDSILGSKEKLSDALIADGERFWEIVGLEKVV